MRTKPLLPNLDMSFRRWRQIRYCRGNRVEPRFKCQRQQSDRAVHVEGRQRRRRLRKALNDARQPRQQRTKRLVDHENDFRTLFGKQRNVTRKLEGVAESLVGETENALSADGFLAEP